MDVPLLSNEGASGPSLEHTCFVLADKQNCSEADKYFL